MSDDSDVRPRREPLAGTGQLTSVGAGSFLFQAVNWATCLEASLSSPRSRSPLKWSDRAGNMLKVRRARSMVGGRRDIAVQRTKTVNGRRDVGMSQAAASLWKTLQARQSVASLDGYVFTTDGEPVHTGEIVKMFEQIRDTFLGEHPEVPRITFYGTRHTAITSWVAANFKPEVVHKWAGHKKYSFTIERYYKTTADEHEAAIAALG